MPAQPRFMDDDQMVQALSANRTNDPLDVGSLLRHSRRAEYFMDTKLSYLLGEVLPKLLRRPFRRGLRRDPEVQDPAAHLDK
jgi:hypothetical protein